MAYKSLEEEIMTELESSMLNALQDNGEVSETAKDLQIEAINEEVYGVYSPRIYNRRYSNKGLEDKRNMKVNISKIPNGFHFSMTNETKTNPYTNEDGSWKPIYSNLESDYNLDMIIEEGMGGNEPYSRPRPFIQETQNKINNSNEIEQSIVKALRNAGFDAK